MHGDPVAEPGSTWWAARPNVPDDWNPPLTDPQDRVDFVYAAGSSQTVESAIVGEDAAAVAAGLDVGAPRLAAVQPALNDVSIALAPWPSDHRGVVSTFELTPDPVAVDDWLLTVGEKVVVGYHAPAAGKKQLTLAPAAGQTPAPELTASGGETPTPDESAAGASSAANETPASVEPARGVTIPDGAADGVARPATEGLQPGAYDVVLSTADRAVGQASVWLQAPGAQPQLTTAASTYAVGQPIVVSRRDAPANRWDWLGVYKAPADLQIDSYLIWQYAGGASAGTLHGKPAGAVVLDGKSTEGGPWPLPSGKYQVFYLLADGYDVVAEAMFSVTQ